MPGRNSIPAVLGLLLGLGAASAAPSPSPSVQVRPLISIGAANRLVITREEPTELRYRVEVGELTATDVVTDAGTFSRLLIPGFHHSHTEGAPELPMMNRLIEIPYGASVRIEILSQVDRSIDLAAAAIAHPLYPAQPPMPKDADPARWPFVYDRAAYQATRVARDLVAVVDQGSLRGVRIGRLEVSPVEYFPAQDRIVVHEAIEFRVVFENADRAAGNTAKLRTWSPFFEPVLRRLDGYRTPHDEYPDLVRDVVTMVVVTPQMFAAQLGPLVEWKRARGFLTIPAVLGAPQVGTTRESVQRYLRDLYLNATPELPAPSFVLFVGDVDQMPTWFEDGVATDRPYCCIDDDVVPDIYYGRASAQNPAQLDAILEKTLMYEQFTMPDPSYLGEAVLVAGMDATHGATWANGQMNYGATYYFNAMHGIQSHSYLYPQSGSHAADIVADVSEGVAFVNYAAHGSETSWLDPEFTQADVNGLENEGEYCLAIGNACDTGSYAVGECFAETWLRAADKGAIGYIGASSSSYWDEDYWWSVGAGPVSAHPTYEQTGLGAYDGVFHDHGEPMDNWYVVNDALVFCGNLAVTEAGGAVEYYWNIYNLMGDPSIATYLGVPAPNPVVHPASIFTNAISAAIEAVPGSYAGLTLDGELIGAGTVGAGGALELGIRQHPLSPGMAHLVVMAQNRVPYRADLEVIAAANVEIEPSLLQVNVATDVAVTVWRPDGQTPWPGVDVWAEVLDYGSTHSQTNEDGRCTLSVNCPYGPAIEVVGRAPGENWDLFRAPVSVQALPLTGADLTVTTGIALADSFGLGWPGVIRATVPVPGHTLWAFLNAHPGVATSADTLELAPGELGSVRAVVAVSGYDLCQREFPVIVARGTLAGRVDAAGQPGQGAMVRGYDQAQALIFEAVADAEGRYDAPAELLVGSYTITADLFGCVHWEQPYFVHCGANALDIGLVASPVGVLTGTVAEAGTGAPLAATVLVYRSDTGALYTQADTDPVDGSYTTAALPYFDYLVTARAWLHAPQSAPITIGEPVVVRDFDLTAAGGRVLIVDDSAYNGVRLPKRGPKTPGAPQNVVARGPARDPVAGRESGEDFKADLEELGFTVTREPIASTDPETWTDYDLLLVSCGNNQTPMANAALRSALVDYVGTGGKLLIEGGELAYATQDDAPFRRDVMHIDGWSHDESGLVTAADPDHYVMSAPNPITAPIPVTYLDYGDQDGVVAAADADRPGGWSMFPTEGSVVAFDPNPAPEGGQIVFYTFNYANMQTPTRARLLENTVVWLQTTEAADASVSGNALLSGEENHAGIRIEARPGGAYAFTNEAGEYTLPNLTHGIYALTATKEGWSTEVQEVELELGQHLTGVDFALEPVPVYQDCHQPHLLIPDNNPQGVADGIAVALGTGATVLSLEVYVDITHTYRGDLVVSLTSPAGTTVLLHNRTGGGLQDIIGWYPSELQPAQSLDAFIGEQTNGVWTLRVADMAGDDTGTFNAWCLRITYDGDPMGAGESQSPHALALHACRPNPAGGAALLRFELPRPASVDLAICDVAGRRVATPLSGLVPAGAHQIAWNGMQAGGHPVPAGVYFAVLRADGRTLSRRVTIVR